MSKSVTTLTTNLKLKIDPNLTPSARYNLERIDSLAGITYVDSADNSIVRSKGDLFLFPNDASLGGPGTGGTVQVGTASTPITSFVVYADAPTFSAPLRLKDQASGGTQFLKVAYNSTVSGGMDAGAERTLSLDVQGADRTLVLAGNLVTSGGDLTFLSAGPSTVQFPAAGTLATLAGTEAFTNKTLDGDLNTIVNIGNGGIKEGAGIAYSKLNLSSSILNSDISSTAGISYSKLNLSGQLVNSDVSTTAAIAGTKVAPNFGTQQVSTAAGINLQTGTYSNVIEGPATPVGSTTFRLPATQGTLGQSLVTDGTGNTSWSTISGGGGGNQMTLSWVTADGTSRTVNHGWNTRNVMVEVIDNSSSYETVQGLSITRPTSNTVQLVSSSSPLSEWTILLRSVN